MLREVGINPECQNLNLIDLNQYRYFPYEVEVDGLYIAQEDLLLNDLLLMLKTIINRRMQNQELSKSAEPFFQIWDENTKVIVL